MRHWMRVMSSAITTRSMISGDASSESSQTLKMEMVWWPPRKISAYCAAISVRRER